MSGKVPELAVALEVVDQAPAVDVLEDDPQLARRPARSRRCGRCSRGRAPRSGGPPRRTAAGGRARRSELLDHDRPLEAGLADEQALVDLAHASGAQLVQDRYFGSGSVVDLRTLYVQDCRGAQGCKGTKLYWPRCASSRWTSATADRRRPLGRDGDARPAPPHAARGGPAQGRAGRRGARARARGRRRSWSACRCAGRAAWARRPRRRSTSSTSCAARCACPVVTRDERLTTVAATSASPRPASRRDRKRACRPGGGGPHPPEPPRLPQGRRRLLEGRLDCRRVARPAPSEPRRSDARAPARRWRSLPVAAALAGPGCTRPACPLRAIAAPAVEFDVPPGANADHDRPRPAGGRPGPSPADLPRAGRPARRRPAAARRPLHLSRAR